jgi:TonB family protein
LVKSENFSHEDKERLAIGGAVGIGMHVFFFIVLSLIKWETNQPLPDLTGPVYITLETSLEEEKPTEQLSVTKNELPQGKKSPPKVQPVEKPKEEPKDQVIPKPEPKKERFTTLTNQKEPKENPPVKQEENRAEVIVTKQEKAEHQVPIESEKHIAGANDSVKGQDVEQQTEKNSILENEKLSQLEKALTQNKDTGSNKSNDSKQGTSTEGNSSANASGKGKSGPEITWEEPGQARNWISRPEPDIPSWVSEQGVQLKVIVSFVVTPEGSLMNVTIERSSGYTDVDNAIKTAVRRWRFQATSSTKSPKATVTYNIQLN